MICEAFRKKIPALQSKPGRMHPHSTDGEGAQVALLQSPILPAVLTPYTKRKIYRPPLTNHIPENSCDSCHAVWPSSVSLFAHVQKSQSCVLPSLKLLFHSLRPSNRKSKIAGVAHHLLQRLV